MPIAAAILILVLAGCSLAGSGKPVPAASSGMPEYKFFMPKTEGDFASAVAAGDVSHGIVIAKVAASFDTAAFDRLGFTVSSSFDLEGFRYFRLQAQDKTRKRLADLSHTSGVIYAEHELVSTITPIEVDGDGGARAAADIRAVLDDPLTWGAFGHFETTHALDAYRDVGFGPNTVYAATIGTGINRVHEEFHDADGNEIIEFAKSAFRRNPDGSFTFVGDSNPFVEVPEGENWDHAGTGTQEAGVIAAMGNNGKGVAGVAWKNVKLISYKSFASYVPGSGSNWSMFGPFKDLVEWKESHHITQTIPVAMNIHTRYATWFDIEMINFALSHGIVIIAPMSNEGTSSLQYPASYAGVIAVGATRANGDKASFSSMGKYLSVMAPGYNILSTSSTLSRNDTSVYKDMSSTSMSASFVTGLVAYMLTFDPTLTGDQIKTILEETAQDMGTSGWDQETGYGQVDVEAAVQRVKDKNIPAPGAVYSTGKVQVSVCNTNPEYDSGIPAYPRAVVGQSVYLYDANGAYVSLGFTNSVDGSTEFQALRPGTYKAVINYYGQKREGTATLTNSADQRITLNVDELVVWLQTVPNKTPEVTGFPAADTILTLYDAQGTVIAGPYDVSGLDSMGVNGLTPGAIYYLQITPYFSNYGEYGLHVGFGYKTEVATMTGRGTVGQDDAYEPNENAGQATPIQLGTMYGQYLGNNQDWFVFTMPGDPL